MKLLIFIAGLLLSYLPYAQVITGKVSNEKNGPLVGATVANMDNTITVVTDNEGAFSIAPRNNVSIKKLVASYTGYLTDTITIDSKTSIHFVLKPVSNLESVTVNATKPGIFLSNLSAIKTEQITQEELKKSACCDLAGCFETQLTVQPQTTNIVTNSKELRILGLSGVYNQVLVDGLPMIQGLSYTYGISGIPGTLVENIYVAKGANSVIQGFESISGQINVETIKPNHAPKLLLNAYVNSFMEKHLNANYAFKTGKWHSLLAVHTVQPANKTDNDDDGFLDLPLLTRYMINNKWRYGNDAEWGLSSSIGIRFLNEKRIGGQLGFNAKNDKGSTNVYGQTAAINQPEIWTKTNYRFDDKHNIVLAVSSFHQSQDSYLGTLHYKAKQLSVYANVQHELNYKKHTLKSGISFRHLNIDENIRFTANIPLRTYAGNYLKNENIAGIFTENTMKFSDNKLTWIAGIRLDHHNQFSWQFTPRTLVKYDLFPNTIIRGNIGTGWRTINLFSENINLLASSRDIIITEGLNPEKALNTGINLVQKFKLKSTDISGSVSLDYYYTRFSNQIFPDYDTDATKAFIKNFTGKSVSNGFQVEAALNFYKRVEFKAGYNYLDVYQMNGSIKNTLPFNPKHKVLSAISFKPANDKYFIDINAHWFGKQRLPGTASNPEAYRRSDLSKDYTVVNAQFTYKFKKIEWYTGCENIFNFRQDKPIISWQNPFSDFFDTSSVWGPTRGREFYTGVRFKIEKK